MLVSKKIKIEVSDQDAATLEFMQGKCRGLYNWWVMKLRNGEHWPGVYAAKKMLKNSRLHDPELNHVYNKLLQEVFFRLGKAMDAFFQMLTYKCQLYRKKLVILDERDTSKTCSGCEHKQDMPLWKRTYRCPKYGLVMDRDENSAINLLVRYLARLGPYAQLECDVLQDTCLEVASVRLAQAGERQKSTCFHTF